MRTTTEDIKRWFDTGVSEGHKWMIIVVDTFDYEDYPIYADTVAEFDNKYTEHNGKNMQRIMETYDLSKEVDLQVKKTRTWEFPEKSRYNPVKPKDENAVLSWLG